MILKYGARVFSCCIYTNENRDDRPEEYLTDRQDIAQSDFDTGNDWDHVDDANKGCEN